MAVELDELVVGDEPASWEAAGFAVDPDGVSRIGGVRVRLVGRQTGKRILSWSFRGVPAAIEDIDGLATRASDLAACEPAEHGNGALSIDHVVLVSPDAARTVGAFEGAGLEVRRVKDIDESQYGFKAVQTFFRAGEAILELLGATEPTPDGGPARFFGLAHTVADLDALADRCGERIGAVKAAVQPGRRIATLRHKAFDMSVATAFMTPEP